MSTNKTSPFNVVCLFARERGVEVLKGLLDDGRFSIIGLLVHSKLPKSEDPERAIRPEFSIFKEISHRYSIPFSTVDSRKEANELEFLGPINSFDILITVSWRFLVPKDIFSRARIAAVNVHRGKLPTYAGAEPIKRALENGEKNVVLTVHEMVEEIDAGTVLIEKIHPVNFDNLKTLEENVERIKKEMLPLYPIAVLEAIDLL